MMIFYSIERVDTRFSLEASILKGLPTNNLKFDGFGSTDLNPMSEAIRHCFASESEVAQQRVVVGDTSLELVLSDSIFCRTFILVFSTYEDWRPTLCYFLKPKVYCRVIRLRYQTPPRLYICTIFWIE